MEGHATDGAQVCREGWPDGAVVVHKGAGMEGQMVGGWIKRFPAGPGGWPLAGQRGILTATKKPKLARGATLGGVVRNGYRGRKEIS